MKNPARGGVFRDMNTYGRGIYTLGPVTCKYLIVRRRSQPLAHTVFANSPLCARRRIPLADLLGHMVNYDALIRRAT